MKRRDMLKTFGATAAHLPARQAGERQADGFPGCLGGARQHAVSQGWQLLRHAGPVHADGQPFPSISSFDKPVANPDGSTDIYFEPSAPQGHEKNWLRTIPGKGYFVICRLYGPTQPYFDQA